MTQNQRLAEHLVAHSTITRAEAFRIGIANLWARIAELEKPPYSLTIWHEDNVDVINQFGEHCKVTRYHLVDKVPYG